MANRKNQKTLKRLLEDTQGAIDEMENEEDDIDLDVYGSEGPDSEEESDSDEFDLDGEDEILDLDNLDDTSVSDDDDAVNGMSISDDEEGSDDDAATLVSQLKDILGELEGMIGSDDEPEMEFGDDESDLDFGDEDMDIDMADDSGMEDDEEFDELDMDDEESEMSDDDMEEEEPVKESVRRRRIKEEQNMEIKNVIPGNPSKPAKAKGSELNVSNKPGKTNLPGGKGAKGSHESGALSNDEETDKQQDAARDKNAKDAKPLPKGKNSPNPKVGLDGKPLETKPTDPGKKLKEDRTKINVRKEAFRVDISKEIAGLVSADNSLSEAAQRKAAKMFTNAVNKKVDKIVEASNLKYTALLEKRAKQIEESLVAKLDEYLDYVVENYVEENQIAIDEGLKNRLSDSFLNEMNRVFEMHYVSIPEGKENLVNKLEREIAETRKKVDEVYEKGIKLRKENIELRKDRALRKLSEDLSTTQAAKFRELAESVEYRDQKSYVQTLGIVKKTHFGSYKPKPANRLEFESLAEETQGSGKSPMDAYLRALTKTKKK